MSPLVGSAVRERWPWRLLPTGDLLRDAVYRRLWLSVLISSFGAQVTMLAIPLTAAVLLHATPTQMGWLTTVELLPFVLFSLPVGVWLDRVRKLPLYIAGEALLALAVGSVPLAWAMGALSMGWLYAVGFVGGMVHTVAGSAAQIVLTQVVPRERLVEAHARNSLASSSAEVAGPGVAGVLIRLLGAPLALLADAAMLLLSALVLRSTPVQETPAACKPGGFWQDLREGLRFVAREPLLRSLALAVGLWQIAHQSAMVVQILIATRQLGMSESAVGTSYVALGVGTVTASLLGDRLSRRFGPGPSLLGGFALTGMGWGLLALAPVGPWGVAAFALNLALFGLGAVLIFINFIGMRQAVTPEPLLGRMTSTMRWLILLPAGPGALLGGWIGEHVGLRASLAFAGAAALALSVGAAVFGGLLQIRRLPKPAAHVPFEVLDDATT
ncbi:putative MFS family arabinose efflux permease [Tibeticola sediminis]|uniref:Putative MFS family arabinose efflux permease n=1 Tax=Tibeticola sediminis TaxID=1917811 RepID=A0A3N4UJT6_9BURK|nr:MFS transporter [Tibeticola sediminis]RPE70713.1 putative MFS family arabinose efflux permease [Tibeticola sediminis]